MKRLSHYLYKYPHSKNFYFRVRIPNQTIKLFSLENQFFIGSLNTSDLNVTQGLALLIKSLLFRESSMWDYSEAMDMVREIREAQQGIMIDFHSFRTTFISRLKFKGCDGYMVKQVVGHMKSDNVTFERYGKNTSTLKDALKELVEEIDY